VRVPALLAEALHRGELVLEDGLGIIKQAANERGFSVIDGAGGSEAEKVHGIVKKEKASETGNCPGNSLPSRQSPVWRKWKFD
jgi:hypothetical protein